MIPVLRSSLPGRAQQGRTGPDRGQPGRPQPGRTRTAWHADRVVAALRRHWLAAGLLAAGLVLRLLAQLAYRPALFYIDTTKYLYNANGNDPVGYKAPLRAILLVGNLNTVAAIQHLLGLAMAVTLYLLLLRRGAPRWLAALATAPVLLDAYQLQIEQTIMPDVWFEALIVAGLAVLLWQPAITLRAAITAGLLLGSSATFRQVGEILILPAVIYLLAASAAGSADPGPADPGLGPRGGGRRRAIARPASRCAALCAAFALPILAYCTGSYALTGHFWLSHSGATSTYGRMAAAADCATLQLPAAERALCPTSAQRALGPDGLEHSSHSPLRPYYANRHVDASRLVSDFNRHVLIQQPLRVLAATSRDMVKLFAVTRSTSPGDTPISRWQFQASYPTFWPHATRPVIVAASRRFGGGLPAVWPPVAAFLRSYQLDGGYTPGPLLAIAALAGLAGSLALLRRRDRPARRQLALACLLFFSTAAAVLLSSDLFEFSWRYQLPALITLPPAGALGISVILRSARRRAPGDGTG